MLTFALNGTEEMAGKTAGALVQNKGSGTNMCELIIVFFTTKHIKRKEKPVSPKDVHFYKAVEKVIFIESTHDMCFFNGLCGIGQSGITCKALVLHVEVEYLSLEKPLYDY